MQGWRVGAGSPQSSPGALSPSRLPVADLHKPCEAFVRVEAGRDGVGARELELGQLDLRLTVGDAGRYLAPGAPLFDGLVK